MTAAMRTWIPALFAGMLHAASIHGVVIENQSGHPLPRALVVAQPLAGGAPQSARTNIDGVFQIDGLREGAYLVSASRRGFAGVEYGQKRWRSAGFPVVLQTAQSANLEIRLPRFGAITGRVSDENDVGMMDHEVIAYRATHPPQYAARATTDDRGVYRISGLDPGAYLVRTLAKVYDDGGYVPTFFGDVLAAAQTTPVEVDLDQDSTEVNIRPKPGRLFPISGTVYVPGWGPATVTLTSDTGSITVTTDARGRFQFNLQPPGKYDLYASSPGDRYSGPSGSYLALDLQRETEVHMNAAPLPKVTFSFMDSSGAAIDTSRLEVIARQNDLSGNFTVQHLRAGSPVQLAPGPWQFAMAPNSTYYAVAFETSHGHADGWNDAMISGQSIALKFVLSANPGAVHGTVTSSSQGVSGAPVFLEALDLEPARRLAAVLTVRAGAHGEFAFTGLAPGRYRLLSTFEYRSPDSAALDAAGAAVVNIEAGKNLKQDLSLYVLP
jgi:hypothetical protein